jgi:hypothetical protein
VPEVKSAATPQATTTHFSIGPEQSQRWSRIRGYLGRNEGSCSLNSWSSSPDRVQGSRLCRESTNAERQRQFVALAPLRARAYASRALVWTRHERLRICSCRTDPCDGDAVRPGSSQLEPLVL